MTPVARNSKLPSVSHVGDRCCGCGACAAICPATCLSMERDDCGFVHPAYESGCIGCGMCERACPVLSVGESDAVVSVSWAKASDDKERERSSSGGIFGLLAQKVLDVHGAVYGAAFADGCKSVHHVRIDATENLDSIMRSKYVQSTVGDDVYKGLTADLTEKRMALFAGTACQNAAVHNYLKVRKVPTDKLLMVDVICHGVPSPRLWSKWLEWVSREGNTEIDEVNFRSKSTGWLTYSVAYYAATEKVKSEVNGNDWYMRAFLQNAALRESCLSCPSKRCCGSDITLGDFWGLQENHPEALDNLGVSAVICNTAKGEKAINAIQSQIVAGPSSLEEIIPGNPALLESVVPYPRRKEFLADVSADLAIDKLMAKWKFEPSMKQRVKSKLRIIKHRLMG